MNPSTPATDVFLSPTAGNANSAGGIGRVHGARGAHAGPTGRRKAQDRVACHSLAAQAQDAPLGVSGEQLLLMACASGDVDTVRELMRSGIDPNARDEGSRTAGMVACLRGHCQVLEVLMLQGLDLAATDAEGRGMNHYLQHFGVLSDDKLAQQAAYKALLAIKRAHQSGRKA